MSTYLKPRADARAPELYRQIELDAIDSVAYGGDADVPDWDLSGPQHTKDAFDIVYADHGFVPLVEGKNGWWQGSI